MYIKYILKRLNVCHRVLLTSKQIVRFNVDVSFCLTSQGDVSEPAKGSRELVLVPSSSKGSIWNLFCCLGDESVLFSLKPGFGPNLKQILQINSSSALMCVCSHA